MLTLCRLNNNWKRLLCQKLPRCGRKKLFVCSVQTTEESIIKMSMKIILTMVSGTLQKQVLAFFLVAGATEKAGSRKSQTLSEIQISEREVIYA